MLLLHGTASQRGEEDPICSLVPTSVLSEHQFSQHSLDPQLDGANQVLCISALRTKKHPHEDPLTNSFINLWAFSNELEWESMIDVR